MLRLAVARNQAKDWWMWIRVNFIGLKPFVRERAYKVGLSINALC
jgi:hypothetical protein